MERTGPTQDSLAYRTDFPKPLRQPDEVLVKTVCSSVNPVSGARVDPAWLGPSPSWLTLVCVKCPADRLEGPQGVCPAAVGTKRADGVDSAWCSMHATRRDINMTHQW